MAAAPVSADNVLEVTPLGAGNEVGRSCIIASFRYAARRPPGGDAAAPTRAEEVLIHDARALSCAPRAPPRTLRSKTVMLDCGIHPGYSGLMSLPFFDEVDLAAVDVILVTHFHLDHCAALPYVLAKTDFKGKVLMTHPTKVIYHTLMIDFVRLSKSGGATDADGARAGTARAPRGTRERERQRGRRRCAFVRRIEARRDGAIADARICGTRRPASADTVLFNEADVNASMDRIEVIDFHQSITLRCVARPGAPPLDWTQKTRARD